MFQATLHGVNDLIRELGVSLPLVDITLSSTIPLRDPDEADPELVGPAVVR